MGVAAMNVVVVGRGGGVGGGGANGGARAMINDGTIDRTLALCESELSRQNVQSLLYYRKITRPD